MKPIHLVLLLPALVLTWIACEQPPEDTIEEGPAYYSSITETGELQAVNSQMIMVPFYGWEYGKAKLIWLEKEGTLVQKGDLVALLDTSSVKRVKTQKEADLEIALADQEQLRVEQASALQQLEADLKSAKAALQLAEVEMQRVQYESEIQKQIINLRYQTAQLELDKISNKIKHTKIIHREALLIEKEKVRQVRGSIEKATRAIERFSIRAPASGIVEYARHRRSRNKIAVGEEFWPTDRLIGLPDLSKMKVRTNVVETDVSKIEKGQRVLVRLDAYPKVAFEGKIQSIAITCREKDDDSRIKVFDIEALIDEADPILRPGMTVSCEIFLERT